MNTYEAGTATSNLLGNMHKTRKDIELFNVHDSIFKISIEGLIDCLRKFEYRQEITEAIRALEEIVDYDYDSDIALSGEYAGEIKESIADYMLTTMLLTIHRNYGAIIKEKAEKQASLNRLLNGIQSATTLKLN